MSRRTLSSKAAAFAWALLAAAAVAAAERPAGLDAVARERIAAALPGTVVESVAPAPVPGLYELVAGDNVLYTDAAGRYLVVGHIYDLATATDLTQARRQDLASAPARIDWDELPLEAAVVHGVGARRLAVFSDPDCPWCVRLRQSLIALLGDVRIFEILYPLRPGSRSRAEAVLCAPDPAAALEAAFDGAPLSEPTPECRERTAQALDTALALGEARGIHGTPTLVSPDGRLHAGYLDETGLRAFLDAHAH